MINKISAMVFFLFMVSFGQDTIRPIPLYKTAPEYPESAKNLQVEAQIFLDATINKQGFVSKTSLLQAIITYAGKSVLIETKNDFNKIPLSHRNSAAKLIEISHQTAKVWKFNPATINGKPEESVIVIPFTFKLNKIPKQNNITPK